MAVGVSGKEVPESEDAQQRDSDFTEEESRILIGLGVVGCRVDGAEDDKDDEREEDESSPSDDDLLKQVWLRVRFLRLKLWQKRSIKLNEEFHDEYNSDGEEDQLGDDKVGVGADGEASGVGVEIGANSKGGDADEGEDHDVGVDRPAGLEVAVCELEEHNGEEDEGHDREDHI